MKVLNQVGCQLNMSESDYNRLIARGIKLTKIEDDKTPTDKIGAYLQILTTGEKHCASDRIRGEWIIKNSDRFEIYDSSKKYNTIIFHKPIPEINKLGGIKILDLCDSVWKQISDFTELIKTVSAIVVSTEGLKEELEKITDKDIYVIGDGHDFKYYETRIENKHLNKAKEIVWFGYAQNSKCLFPYFKTIKEQGLKLKVISQCPLPPLDKADKFVKWDVDTCVEEISKSDFALLPLNGKLKSNNKDITAYLSGIPVAKNEQDILRLIDPQERRFAMKKLDVKKFDAKVKAKEYLNLISKLKNDIEVYTAICGGYEKERNDIKVFTDDSRFKDPVMNAKIYKVLSHKFFRGKTVWVDGNISLNVEPNNLLELLGDNDIAVFRHPYRSCIYQEHPHAKDRLPEDQKPSIDKQIADYRKEGMPQNYGLAECGMIIRKNNPIVEEFNNRWWAEITRYSRRDQISFPYVLWKMGDRIKVKIIHGNVRDHKYFHYDNHGSK